jgi:hypothetical protein
MRRSMTAGVFLEDGASIHRTRRTWFFIDKTSHLLEESAKGF